MNKSILLGRLTKEPVVRYSQGQEPLAIARFHLAVERRRTKDGRQEADFIPCVAFGKNGEFCEKYLHKGTKIAIIGRIQTGSYEKDGQRVYTTEVVVEEMEFAESKAAGQRSDEPAAGVQDDGFMSIPEGFEDEMPFA